MIMSKRKGELMDSVLNSFATAFNAVMYYIATAVSYITKNKYLLTFTIICIFLIGKSGSVGKLVKVKG